jgi:hypothetical protein
MRSNTIFAASSISLIRVMKRVTDVHRTKPVIPWNKSKASFTKLCPRCNTLLRISWPSARTDWNTARTEWNRDKNIAPIDVQKSENAATIEGIVGVGIKK